MIVPVYCTCMVQSLSIALHPTAKEVTFFSGDNKRLSCATHRGCQTQQHRTTQSHVSAGGRSRKELNMLRQSTSMHCDNGWPANVLLHQVLQQCLPCVLHMFWQYVVYGSYRAAPWLFTGAPHPSLLVVIMQRRMENRSREGNRSTCHA